jgi:hypothetical protein
VFTLVSATNEAHERGYPNIVMTIKQAFEFNSSFKDGQITFVCFVRSSRPSSDPTDAKVKKWSMPSTNADEV